APPERHGPHAVARGGDARPQLRHDRRLRPLPSAHRHGGARRREHAAALRLVHGRARARVRGPGGGRAELAPPTGSDAVYFNAGPLFVHYEAREAPTLAGFGVGLVAIALGVG